MIKKICVKNFRAFESLDIPLSKINVFFGPNNSGKSSILSTLSILSQTCDSPDHGISLLYDGKFGDYGTYSELVYKNEVKRDIEFYLEFPVKSAAGDIIGDGAVNVKYHYRSRRRETVVGSTEIYWPLNKLLISTAIAERGRNQLINEVSSEHKGIITGTKSSGEINLDHFLPFVAYSGAAKIPKSLSLSISRISRSLKRNLAQVTYICPFRAPPERSYNFSGENPSHIGNQGEKAFQILAADELKTKDKRSNVKDKVTKWLKSAHIAKEIYVNQYSERDFQIGMRNYFTDEMENIADVGYGCSQVVPILVAGYALPEDSILLIEQPELHLHPNAEAELGTFFKDIVKEKHIQLLIESHSVHLMLRLQRHVASGKLKVDDINVFFVYPERIGKKRKLVRKIPLGKDGYFTEKWPYGFFPERLEESRELAKHSI